MRPGSTPQQQPRSAARDARARGLWQGMNWVRQATRLAIYLRDGARCVYCGRRAPLTLDHVIPHSRGGANAAANLITACRPCNDRRGARDLEHAIRRRVLGYTRRPLDEYRAEARSLIARHGSAARALAAL